jgi:hypothetical protein
LKTSKYEDIASMYLKKMGYDPLRRYKGMDWCIGPALLAEHKRGVFQKSQVREMSANDAVLVVTDHKSILVFRLDHDASVFNIDSFGGIELPGSPITISLAVPANLWMEISAVLERDGITFTDFAVKAFREEVEKRKEGNKHGR